MYTSILVNIDEIWLKGKNRKFYLKRFKENLRNSVFSQHLGAAEIIAEGPKFFVNSPEGFSENVLEAIARTAGVASLQPCRNCPLDIESIKDLALTELRSLPVAPKTLRVETKRSNKKFPMQSMEVSLAVSHHLFINSENLKGSMKEPEVTVAVRILNEHAYVSTRKIQGVGGLPVGTSDKLLTLLSGGFDSPVASYLMFRRGSAQDLVFFHAHPYVGEAPKEKVTRIARILSRYQSFTRFFIVPFGPLQKRIAELCKEEYRTLFFRIFMLKVAEQLAEKNGACGLVTGDALSQVSSQTMANISAVDSCIDMSILRPLVGFNKLEILDWARKAGTHDVSAEPHDDACALFAPQHPIIRASKPYCQSFTQEHPLTDEVQTAAENVETFIFDQRGEIIPPKNKDNERNNLADFADSTSAANQDGIEDDFLRF